jgi:hypothetical protein
MTWVGDTASSMFSSSSDGASSSSSSMSSFWYGWVRRGGVGSGDAGVGEGRRERWECEALRSETHCSR